MLAYNVTLDVLQAIAHSIDMRIVEYRSTSGRACRFRLGLTDEPYDRRLPYRRWQRTAPLSARRISAVCWHGHREFFRELFSQVPTARVQTRHTRSFDKGQRFYTRENFEDVYERSDVNIGSAYQPTQYSDCCICGTLDDVIERLEWSARHASNV